MLRRNVNTTPGPASGGSAGSSRRNQAELKLRKKEKREGGISTGVLLVIALLLTTVSYLFPSEVEKEAEYVAGQMYTAEHELMDMWKKKAAVAVDENSHTHGRDDATSNMLLQDSKWVDGEKKLKEKLKVLQKRQAEGKDLGVPVLTRYLGEDIPAWPDGTMDEETWKKKVAEKYDEMRKEEEEWKQKILKYA